VIFGNSETFAIEAILEPGPEFASVVGNNVAGRIRLIFSGKHFGNFDEPCCVFGGISDHLSSLTADNARLWHPSLAHLQPEQQFQLLNELFYIGSHSDSNVRQALEDCCFLTNVSEAFDGVKGFALCEYKERFTFILESQDTSNISSFSLSSSEFVGTCASFASWVQGSHT